MGLYLIEGAKGLNCSFAEMINKFTHSEFFERVAAANLTGCHFTMIEADFRDYSLFENLSTVDVSLLYEVILHQDTYVDVIKNVLTKTSKQVCFAQPVLKEDLFALPGGAVLLQFYPEELKDQLRYANWWEKEPPTEQFALKYWMWGHTISYIQDLFKGYGWQMTYQKVYEMSVHWNYALLRFSPK